MVILDNIGSGNGLLPDGTKPLPEPMLTYPHWGILTFTRGQFHYRYLSNQSTKLVWKLLIQNFIHTSQGRMSSSLIHGSSWSVWCKTHQESLQLTPREFKSSMDLQSHSYELCEGWSYTLKTSVKWSPLLTPFYNTNTFINAFRVNESIDCWYSVIQKGMNKGAIFKKRLFL